MNIRSSSLKGKETNKIFPNIVLQHTAMTFSLIPPTGKTRPVNDSSPVIAISCFIGLFKPSDKSAVTIVQPADGPSFGVAP
jgi:hypothetical protein